MPVRRMIVVVLLGSGVALASDWPQFRGPAANNSAPDKGINKDWKTKPPKELWRIALSDSGFAGPSVAAGKLFIIDHQAGKDTVRAVDVSNGKDVWSFPYDDAKNNNYGFTRSTPAFDNGKLYCFSRLGNLFCLDATTGAQMWNRNAKTDFNGKGTYYDYASSPVVDGDQVIVCPAGPDATIVALDKNTGRTLWKGGGSDPAAYATPTVATIEQKRQYIVFTAGGLVGVDTKTGVRTWSFPWQHSLARNIAAPAIHENTLLVSTSDLGSALVKADNGATSIWTNAEVKAFYSTAILFEGYAYITGDPPSLLCLDLKTGKVMWKQRGFGKGSLLLVDGVLIVLDGDTGELAMIEMSSAAYKELGRIKPLGGQSWTAPIMSDGKLYVRNQKSLVCLDLR